jgi:hypothetical protein
MLVVRHASGAEALLSVALAKRGDRQRWRPAKFDQTFSSATAICDWHRTNSE